MVCEDIRREDNGKLILIGVFGRDIGVVTVPTVLGLAICLSIEFDEPIDTEIEFQWLFEEEVKAEVKGRVKVPEPGISMIVVPSLPLEITGEGQISFRFKAADSDWQIAESLPIVDRASTASQRRS